jgi:hypothetical protein
MPTLTHYVNRRKQFLFSLMMFLLLNILFFSSKTFGQIASGVAPIDPPSGYFNIDGDLQANNTHGEWLPGSGTSCQEISNTINRFVILNMRFNI